MPSILGKLLFWTPRVLCLFLAGFVSIFALDVVGADYPLGKLLLALAVHLIPTAAILAALLVAWRWEWLGAVVFAAFGVAITLLKGEQLAFAGVMLIATPCFLLAVLFLLGWIFRKELRSPQTA